MPKEELEMKAIIFIRNISMMAAFVVVMTATGIGQTPPKLKDGKAAEATDAKSQKDIPLPAPTSENQTGDPAELDTPEADSIMPYYNNYLKEYRLGPSDMISVEVFGQCPDYCKTGITVPPTAKISYPLIREGVFVGGKTVEQIQDEVMKKLDEYIIDPKVTVTLDKVGSARYSVLGDVGTPGVKLMERRLSVYEAIVESGGILRTGDRKKVVI